MLYALLVVKYLKIKNMVDISNQHINEDGSITISFKDIEEAKEFVECVNIANEINEEMAKSFINYAYED